MTKYEKLVALLDLVSATIEEINADAEWENSIISLNIDYHGNKEIHVYNPTETFLPHKMGKAFFDESLERREGKIGDCNLYGFRKGA